MALINSQYIIEIVYFIVRTFMTLYCIFGLYIKTLVMEEMHAQLFNNQSFHYNSYNYNYSGLMCFRSQYNHQYTLQSYVIIISNILL